MKWNKRFFAAAGMLVAVSGCTPKLKRDWDKWTGEMPEPKNVITINEIIKYPRAKKIEKEIATFSGRTIWININSFIHSNVVKKVELLPRDGGKYYDLKLFLNRKGRLRWMQLSAGYRKEPLAFVIDGTFYRSFTPKPMVGDYDNNEDTYVVIEGPFDKGTADALVESAPSNFLYYNDEDAEF